MDGVGFATDDASEFTAAKTRLMPGFQHYASLHPFPYRVPNGNGKIELDPI